MYILWPKASPHLPTSPGTDVTLLEIFLAKKMVTEVMNFASNYIHFCSKNDYNIGFP
jgi:hypothetical protein